MNVINTWFDDLKETIRLSWTLVSKDTHGWRGEAWVVATGSFILGAVIF